MGLRRWARFGVLSSVGGALLVGGGCGATSPAPVTGATPTFELSCGSDRAVPVGRPVLGTLAGQTDRHHLSCVREGGPDCRLVLDVPRLSAVRIGVQSDEADVALGLLSRAEGDADELTCSDDLSPGDIHHARIDTTLSAGRYGIVVDAVGAKGGAFELLVQVDPLSPLSAVCAGAPLLVPEQAIRDSTRGAPNLLVASCAGGARGPDVVHRLDIQRHSRVRIIQDSEFDGALYVRQRCEDPSTELSCNDDFRSPRDSMVALSLTAGSYYVVTDSFASAQAGSYGLALQRIDEPPVRLAADVCREAEAQPISEGRLELDTLVMPSTFAGSCGGEGAPEHVLAFRVEVPRELSARLLDPELNGVLYVRAACADPSSELACLKLPPRERLPGRREPSELRVTVEPGTYYLFVDGASSSDMGAATLSVRFGPPVPPL